MELIDKEMYKKYPCLYRAEDGACAACAYMCDCGWPEDCKVRKETAERQPTLIPPNEPLTFEDRREMNGKPVWLDDEKTWGILQVWDDNNVDAVFLRSRGCVCVKSVIGKKIYRYPPEGEEDT